MTVLVRILVNDEPFWERHLPVHDGDRLNLNADKALGDLKRQRDELLAAAKEAREALQFANESPGGGINDTIWMMHRSETLFDFLDAAIEKAQTPIVQHLPADDTEGGGL